MNIKRQIFYSFHYAQDSWRASQVRNIGIVEGNRPASDNDWEKIRGAGAKAIASWIDQQMKYRSCTIVLIGQHTAERDWVKYEIDKSWQNGMGVAGIYIHGLMDQKRNLSQKGKNPFINTKFCQTIKCHNPSGVSSREIYNWIEHNLPTIVEEAIKIRNKYYIL